MEPLRIGSRIRCAVLRLEHQALPYVGVVGRLAEASAPRSGHVAILIAKI